MLESIPRNLFTPNFFMKGQRKKIFIFSKITRPALKPTYPPIQWAVLSLRVKQSGREVDDLPSSRTTVQNEGKYI